MKHVEQFDSWGVHSFAVQYMEAGIALRILLMPFKRRQSHATQAHQQRAKEFDRARYRQRQTQEQGGF
jgi:hypothetical protein